MALINGTLTFVDKNGDDKSIVRVIQNSTEVKIGNHILNDIMIKSEDIEELHCKISFNEKINRIVIKNYSTSHPILINNQVVDNCKELKNGDVITILENSMRWETKDDAKRRISFLSKDERRAMKRKYIKTNKRVTIHSVSVQSMLGSSPEEAAAGSSSVEKFSTPETLASTPESAEEYSSPVKEQQQSILKDIENEKTPVKVNKLNMSGTLLTSYTPPVGKLTRSVSKPLWNSPLRSPLVKSAAKSILNDSLNVSKVDSSPQRLNNSQMHLIDLTTPFVKRNESTSTPKTSSIRKTPRTIGKTPLRNATLLKSAIKNSSIQKQVMQNISGIASKGKQLFDSPAESNTSSLIEISMSSISEIDSSKSTINDNSNCEVQTVEENNGKTTTEEVKEILESIDSVLGEKNRGSEAVSEPEEVISSSQEIDDDFNKIVDNQKLSIGSANESLFDKALNNVPIEDINNFDKLLTDEGTCSTDDPEKKGEIVMKMIEKARESLSTPNKTTQVLSARYSDITNDSLTDNANTSQKYDATTPKISLLETVMSGRKSELTMGPVSRLSLTKDSTEIVENYQLNSNNSESLRSTRKRMRTAMSSIGIMNSSQSADTTLNESLNDSVNTNHDQVDLNQSQPEETNILSLDNQPDMNTSNKENEYSGSLNMSMKFFEYSEFDENNRESKKIFELSNDGDDMIESDNESDSEIEDSPNEDILDEPLDDEILDENNQIDSNNLSTKKCRISQADLESLGEEGIDILEQSKDEDEFAEMLDEANAEIKDVQESEKLEEIAENNGVGDSEVIPEEAGDSNGISELDVIPDTQQMELEEEITEEEVQLDKSEYLDDIPETQHLDLGMEEVLDSNSTLDAIVEALESTKESKTSIESLENIQQDKEELPVNNEDAMDETVEDKQLDETNENEQLDETVEDKQIDDTIVSEQLENTVDDQLEESFAEDVEIPATQAFEFDDSIVEERLDETIENLSLKVEVSQGKFSSIGSVISVDDSTIISSQDPVNKSDTADSISIQEISDSSEICSQESIAVKEESNTQSEANTDENEIVNKSVAEATCTAQNSKETITSLDSNVSETINELIAAPTDILTSIAIVQQYSTSEIGSDHMEIPATQEMLDDDDFDNDETVQEKTAEGDSAIGTTSSKIDQSNESEEKRVVDDSFTAETPNQNRESALFSDTEFSNVEINASAFMKESDSDDFPEIKNNKELTYNETNQAQSDILEEGNGQKQNTSIEKELDNVDFEKKIVRKGFSILPTEHERPSGSRQTMIPEKMDDSFAALLEHKQKELKESELIETEAVQDEIVTRKNDEIEITSSVNEEKMNEIEMELARMNDEPMTNIEKKRPASMMPQFEDGENSDRITSRMTMIPSKDNRRPSFIVCLEEEKAELLKQKESIEFIEEKPKLFNDDEKEAQDRNELNSDNNEEREPVVEEPCIQKQAYVTTESEKQITAPETPSRRRVARVNYSELATGSPARSRRGRSASTESNGEKEKEPKSAVKHKEKVIKMEPIVEDELSVQITVTATKNNEQVAESSEETPVPHSEEVPMEEATEMIEKESENMAIDENIEEVPVEENVSEQDADDKMLSQEETTNGQDNEVVPENITDDTEEKSNEPKLSVEHPENLQLMEVPKPENLQLMEVPTPNKLQVMEVMKPDRLQVVEVKTPSREHPKDSDISNKTDTPQKQNDISEPVCEELLPETENIDLEHPTEEQVDESEPIEEVVDEIEDEIIESSEKEDSEPVEEVTDEIIEKESIDSIQEETVQNVDAKPQVEISSEIDEIVQISDEEVPSESVSQEEIAPKSEEVVIEPQTPSRKRAKKLNYLELASGSPARTPRRGRAASTDEKQEKSSKPDLPPTIPEEINPKDEEVVTSTHDGLISKEVTEELKEEDAMPQEVKKKPGRARKIDQLKPDNNEDVPTPSKRSRRGVTPVQTQAPVNEPEKKSRKRQPKVVEPEPEKSHESEVQGDEIIVVSSMESIQEAAKPVAKKGRGKQAKAVDEDKHDEKTEEPQPVKKGRGRKAKADETPIVEEKLPEKVETSPKRGRGRKAVVESHEEEAEKVTETPVAKKSRKRQHDKPTEIEIPKETEDIKTDETAEVTVKSPQPIKKRNRVAKATEDVEHVEEHVQPEKAAPKRGRKGKIETVPEVQEQQEEEIAPKRTGRKAKTEDVIETHEEPAVQEAPKKGRGRKKVEETPKVDEIEHEKVEESAPKRTGRKGKNDIAEQPVHEQPTEESVPKRAGRKGKLETLAAEIHDNQVHETPKRGRKAKVDATPVIQEQPQQVEDVVPKKGGRRGKAEVVVESQEEPVAQEAPKKGRGRKKVEETPKVDEPQSSNVQEEAVPVKKGRGRQAKIVEKVIETKTDETAEVEAPKRGRALKHKVVESDTTDEPVIKKGRGRQAKQEVVSTTEPEIQPIETPKRAKTPAKKNIASKHVTIITPSTMQAHHSKEAAKSEEPVVVKRATKRQAQPVIVEEEPVPVKRSTRVRK